MRSSTSAIKEGYNISMGRTAACFLILAMTAGLVGCTTPQYNYKPVTKDVSTPPLDSVNVANVGDEMLKQGVYTEREAIKLTKQLKIGALGIGYTLSTGYYIKTGEDRSKNFYQPAPGNDGGRVQKTAASDPWESIALSKDGFEISVITIFHFSTSTRAEGVSRCQYLLLNDNAFQQTLIYSGKVGNKVRVGYREFSNNVARPAFNNDVDYDLSESRVIGYKGARIEVLEATNEHIKYRVVSNFNLAQ